MPSNTTQRWAVLQRLVERQLAADAYPGAAIIVAQQGEVIGEIYAGHAAPGLVAGPTVLWPVASISKVYTVAMIMRLVELGELTLNTRMQALIPQARAAGHEQVRLRHLLTHTAGMIYESPLMEQRLRDQASRADLIAEACVTPLLHAPGSRFRYADYHTLLAGHMAEQATGQPFEQLIEELLLRPMGLHDTFIAPPASEHARIAKVRGVLAEGSDGAMYNSAYALGLAHPAFGIVTSARNLIRFMQHFMPGGPRLHAEATVQAMIRDQTGGVPGEHPLLTGFAERAQVPWGLGWGLQTERIPAVFADLASNRSFGHGGASGCHVVADPVAQRVVAVISNSHVRRGPEPWYARQQALLNAAFALEGEQPQ